MVGSFSDRIMVRNVVLVRDRSEGRPHPLGVDNILHGERNAVKKAERPPGHDLTLRIPGLVHGLIAAQRDEAVQFGLECLGAREHGANRHLSRVVGENIGATRAHGREFLAVCADAAEPVSIRSGSRLRVHVQ